jgi:hypothetical protein
MNVRADSRFALDEVMANRWFLVKDEAFILRLTGNV